MATAIKGVTAAATVGAHASVTLSRYTLRYDIVLVYELD